MNGVFVFVPSDRGWMSETTSGRRPRGWVHGGRGGEGNEMKEGMGCDSA